MNRSIRKYLSEIGRRGGMKSRRVLSPQTARDMARIRDARRAFRRFSVSCFWSYDRNRELMVSDIPWIVDQLKKNGDRQAWDAAARLCR